MAILLNFLAFLPHCHLGPHIHVWMSILSLSSFLKLASLFSCCVRAVKPIFASIRLKCLLPSLPLSLPRSPNGWMDVRGVKRQSAISRQSQIDATMNSSKRRRRSKRSEGDCSLARATERETELTTAASLLFTVH